ncbi:MAG: hypothetical protein Q4Q53_01580 [Methanocorpusculum sp.]|nr:hypothetical protein [Methanocorpusculum sp.]
MPPDISVAQLELISDMKNVDTSITIDLYDLADKVGYASSIDEIKEICLNYYGDNIWIEKLIYYNTRGEGSNVMVPELSDEIHMTDYLPIPTQSDLENAGGILHVDCVYVPGEGYVNANYAAVYSSDGTYKGFLILVYDIYVILNLHPLIVDEENTYESYVCFIIDKNNKVVFSTNSEWIGETVPKDGQLNNGQSVIIVESEEYGAYKYSSGAFYNYLRGTNTEKITAWQRFTSYKNTYTIYLVKELNQPEMEYSDIFSIDVGSSLKSVEKAFVYASLHNKEDTLSAITDGLFTGNVAAMDMEGNVLAITAKQHIGLNYMNNRGTYGTSYVESMIYTAQQGGGYVYYLYPVESSIVTRGSQFSIAYILPVDSEWFIFGRLNGCEDVIPMDLSLRSDLTSVSRAVINDAFDDGIDSVILKIKTNSDKGGKEFVSDITNDVSVSVADYNGYMYANSNNPSLVGTIQTGYTDVYGGSTMRKMIMLAKAGGGYMTDLRSNPDKEGYIDLWLYSVEPIDSHYFVDTGIIIGTYEDYLTDYLS